MIAVSNLTKTYGKNRGVNDISFSVPEGQIVGFLGPNGAGKTTTMNVITGYLSAQSGKVEIAGVDIEKKPIEAKRHIGYLPEQPPLYLTMTVNEYLEFVYDLKKVKNDDKKTHIEKICENLGLVDVRKRVIGHLSKGYKQRVGFAQALLGDPEVLILDEPTIGLDPRQIVEIRNVIKDIGKQRTIILSTHILPEVSAVCERVLVIANGKIVADDNPENLTAGLKGNKTQIVRVAGSSDDVRGLIERIEGVSSVKPLGNMEEDSADFIVENNHGTDIRKPLFNALAGAGYPLLMLRPQTDTLEDIFLQLTEEEEKV